MHTLPCSLSVCLKPHSHVVPWVRLPSARLEPGLVSVGEVQDRRRPRVVQVFVRWGWVLDAGQGYH